MRDMFDEAVQIKNAMNAGEDLYFVVRHSKILTAQATEPEKTKSPEFKSLASNYLKMLEGLKNARVGDREEAYKTWISSCTACHKSLCPGPLVRIEKLR